MQILAAMLIYTLVQLVWVVATRRWTIVGLLVNIGFILLLFIADLDGWFRWAKSLSVFLPMLVVHAGRWSAGRGGMGRLGKVSTSPGAMVFFAVIVALNIAEAVLKDFALGNLVNGLAGIGLILVMPFSPRRWRFGSGRSPMLIGDVSLWWGLAYMTWNAAFVYSESPAYFAASVCILLVPEIMHLAATARGRENPWIHARIYTLMLHLGVRGLGDVFIPTMDASAWYDPSIARIWGVVNLVVIGALVLVSVGRHLDKGVWREVTNRTSLRRGKR